MSLFKNIFGDNEESNQNSKMNWNHITDINQLNEIVTLSNEKAVLIFKHSTRCSISRYSLKQFESEFDMEEKITPYFLDLLNHRDISNEISSRFSVMHQSPQILVIKSEKSIYSASHDSIDATFLKQIV